MHFHALQEEKLLLGNVQCGGQGGSKKIAIIQLPNRYTADSPAFEFSTL